MATTAAAAPFASSSGGVTLPNMSVPPPTTPNLSAPPPAAVPPPTSSHPPTPGGFSHRFSNHRDDRGGRGFFKPFRPYHAPKIISGQDALQDEFDGKRLRKSVMRKTVDYNSAIIKSLEVLYYLFLFFCFVYHSSSNLD